MKRSVSSVLAERIEARKRVTPPRISVSYVEATPEEMAYEPPADVSDPRKFPTLAFGRKEWEQFLAVKRGFRHIDPELRKEFPDDASVNEALKAVLQIRQLRIGKDKKRKTA